MDGPEGPPSRQAARARGYQKLSHPVLGYVDVNLQIPGIKSYNEDILLLVIPTMTHSEKLLVMVWSMMVNRVMGMITKGELVRATMTWKQSHFGTVMSVLLKLSCKGTGVGVLQWGSLLLQPLTPLCSKKFCLYHTEGHHSSVWDHQYSQQYRCLRALYVGPCVCQASTGSPAAHFYYTDCHIWRVTPRVLPGANLPEEPEYLPPL